MKKKNIVLSFTLGTLLLTSSMHHAMEKETSQKLPQLECLYKMSKLKGLHSLDLFGNTLVLRTMPDGPNSNADDIKQGNTDGGKSVLFNIQQKEKITEITTQEAFASSFFSFLPQDFNINKLRVRIMDIKRPYIIFNISDIDSSNTQDKYAQYNIKTKEFKEIKKEEEIEERPRKHKTFRINRFINFTDEPPYNQDRYHIHLDTNGNLTIINPTKEKNEIQLDDSNDIYIGKKHILIFNYKHSGIGAWLHKPKLTLYNKEACEKMKLDQTGTPFTAFIPTLQKEAPFQHLKEAIFGEDDRFVLLVFYNQIFLYDLTSHTPVAQYSFEETLNALAGVLFSDDEKEIIVATEKNIYFLYNPLAKPIYDDEKERTEYVLNPECPRAQGEKEPVIIDVGGIKIPVDRGLLLLG